MFKNPLIEDTTKKDSSDTDTDSDTDSGTDTDSDTDTDTDSGTDSDTGTDSEDKEEEDEEEDEEDVGSVSKQQGFKKSQRDLYAFGKTRHVTLLTKDEELGGLTLTLQYVINPATGAWLLQACLAGQSQEDMVEFDSGEDPSSLIKSLKKKKKITAHQAVEYLNPPADSVIKDD